MKTSYDNVCFKVLHKPIDRVGYTDTYRCLLACILAIHVVEAVAGVPRAPVRLPCAHAHPAELVLACLAPADHVVAAAVLLNGHAALGALLQKCRPNHCNMSIFHKCRQQRTMQTFTINTLSYPTSNVYGRILGRTVEILENLILGSVIKIFADTCRSYTRKLHYLRQELAKHLYLRVCRDPVCGLAVVLALLDPLSQHAAPHRLVPRPQALEAA